MQAHAPLHVHLPDGAYGEGALPRRQAPHRVQERHADRPDLAGRADPHGCLHAGLGCVRDPPDLRVRGHHQGGQGCQGVEQHALAGGRQKNKGKPDRLFPNIRPSKFVVGVSELLEVSGSEIGKGPVWNLTNLFPTWKVLNNLNGCCNWMISLPIGKLTKMVFQPCAFLCYYIWKQVTKFSSYFDKKIIAIASIFYELNAAQPTFLSVWSRTICRLTVPNNKKFADF